MSDDAKDLVRRFVQDVQGDGNIENTLNYIAADAVNHSAPPGVPPDGHGAQMIFSMIRQGFPDHDAVVHEMISEGDLVATRKSFTGTHTGEFFGIPPTGKRATIDVIDFVRVRDGAIVEHWNIVDQLGLMQQLGLAQAPG
jgi:predicted ester cyclase